MAKLSNRTYWTIVIAVVLLAGALYNNHQKKEQRNREHRAAMADAIIDSYGD